MSVIVCGQKRAEHPFYLEELGINIYSCQELCYVVYHHPLLFMDGIMDQSLVDFIRNEFNMGFVAARLEQRMKSGEKQEDILLFFMQECNYYTTAELNKLRQTLMSFKKLSVFEYAKDYDPAYGEHFYDLSWNHGIAHEKILSDISVPCVYIHARETLHDSGTLLCAASREQAERAVSYIGSNCRLIETPTSDHMIHTVHRQLYIETVNSLL